MTKRWTQRPYGSTWGDYGEDDQLGRLNLLTPEKVLDGAREIISGRAFCLSLPLDYPGGAILNPRRRPPRLQPLMHDGCPCMNFPLSLLDQQNADIICDDEVTLALQYSTQWDSFAHVGSQFDVMGDGKLHKVYYNGFRANADVVGPRDYDASGAHTDVDGPYGAHALGISNLAQKGMQGRAVMIDLKRHFGLERRMVGFEEIQHVIASDQIDVRPGDMLLLRTGYTEVLVEMDKNPIKAVLDATGCALDGRDGKLLDWITRSEITAICADNYAVEGLPARISPGVRPSLPLHHHCLFKLGVALAELWWLGELADWMALARRSACFLTAPPLNLPGAVGSPVTPIATV